jgi:hypothetical protein
LSKPTDPLSGAVLKEDNSKHMMKMKKTSRSDWEYFSSRDELIGEVGKYCTNPENYDTSKYGYVMRLVYNL